jgi:hypothetical protein
VDWNWRALLQIKISLLFPADCGETFVVCFTQSILEDWKIFHNFGGTELRQSAHFKLKKTWRQKRIKKFQQTSGFPSKFKGLIKTQNSLNYSIQNLSATVTIITCFDSLSQMCTYTGSELLGEGVGSYNIPNEKQKRWPNLPRGSPGVLELWNVWNIKEFSENLRSESVWKSDLKLVLSETSILNYFGTFCFRKNRRYPSLPPKKKINTICFSEKYFAGVPPERKGPQFFELSPPL